MKNDTAVIVSLRRISMMIAAMVLLCFACGGCKTVQGECPLPDGRVIKFKSQAFLWQTEMDDFTIDVNTGKASFKRLGSGSDKESIANLCEAIKDLSGKLITGAATGGIGAVIP